MIERDWFATFKQLLEASAPSTSKTPAEVDALIADIVSGRIQAPTVRLRRARRRWWIIGGTTIVLVAGSGVAVALWNRAEPSETAAGIGCRAAPALDADVVVVEPADDPLVACSRLWQSGALPDVAHGGPPVETPPALFACVGPHGELEVYPATDRRVACVDLGLVDAITPTGSDPQIALQDRLSSEVNAGCVGLDEAKRRAAAALDDLGLRDWTVTVRDNITNCVKVGLVATTKTIYLFSLPT